MLFSDDLKTIHLYTGVMKKLGEYYSAFVPSHNIYTEMSIPAEHAMVRLCEHISTTTCKSIRVLYIRAQNL